VRGGALPPSLLCASLGIALAFAPRKAVAPAAAVLVVAAFGSNLARFGSGWPDIAFLGCWISVLLISGSIHLPDGLGQKLALLLALDAGLWAGAVTAVTGTRSDIAGSRMDLALALPWVLLVLPARWMVSKGWGVVVKVAGGWLIAVSILAAGLSMVPTPGYVPDHME
jgi:hypothetical protein